MLRTFSRLMRIELAPPAYLAPVIAGVDLSISGIKIVTFKNTAHGVELDGHAEERFTAIGLKKGEVTDRETVIPILKKLSKKFNITDANIALPEAHGHLFEAIVPGKTKVEWRDAIARNLEKHIPLPPADAVFDVVPLAPRGAGMYVVGVAYERRVVDATLAQFASAGITVRAIESELFSLPRAILPQGDTETVLIIDVGKTTTKLLIASSRVPRFAKTLAIGGHALTLAVQKHFGVTEEEARRVKAERGLVVGDEKQEYLKAMLSTVSTIRDEIVRHLDYWQTRTATTPVHAPVTRAVLVGGNATLRGLPEYLAVTLKIPVELGDVFHNLAPRSEWLPPLDYTESLAYGTAIGLALREYTP